MLMLEICQNKNIIFAPIFFREATIGSILYSVYYFIVVSISLLYYSENISKCHNIEQ